MPANVIAIVAQVPDRKGERGGVITRREFQHGLLQAAAQEGRRVPPKPGVAGFGKLRDSAIGELLDDSWIRGQAAEMGVGLRPRAVTRELNRIKKEAFSSGEEYRHFLREAHYTRRDVLDRVEIQLFAERIQERVVAGIPGRKAQEKAFTKFVHEYGARWRARTVCAPGYLTERCSNGPAPESLFIP